VFVADDVQPDVRGDEQAAERMKSINVAFEKAKPYRKDL
jgi:hypothetical protein